MSVIPIAALTIGALLLALGLSSSSRNARRDRRDCSGDGGASSGGGIGDGGDCGGGDGGGGCD